MCVYRVDPNGGLCFFLSLLAAKPPAKPVESIKPRLRADFVELQKLLTDMILKQKVKKKKKKKGIRDLIRLY